VVVLATSRPGVGSAEPAPITDCSSFPAPLPVGCTVDGAVVVPGAQFAVNGQMGPDLAAVADRFGRYGDDDLADGRTGGESLGIGLSVEISQSTSFNENDDQYLQSFSSCGPEGPTCTIPASVSMQVLNAAVVPCFQLDAHIGRLLALVSDPPAPPTAAASHPMPTC